MTTFFTTTCFYYHLQRGLVNEKLKSSTSQPEQARYLRSAIVTARVAK